MEFQKKQWNYHLILLSGVAVMDIFRYYVLNGHDNFFLNLRYPYYLYLMTFYGVFCCIYFLNYYLICPRTVSKRKIFGFAISVLLLLLLHSGLRYFLEEVLLFRITGIHNYFESSRRFGYYVIDNSYYAIKAILFSTSLYLVIEFVANKNKIHSLQLEHKKAELSLLKT